MPNVKPFSHNNIDWSDPWRKKLKTKLEPEKKRIKLNIRKMFRWKKNLGKNFNESETENYFLANVKQNVKLKRFFWFPSNGSFFACQRSCILVTPNLLFPIHSNAISNTTIFTWIDSIRLSFFLSNQTSIFDPIRNLLFHYSR